MGCGIIFEDKGVIPMKSKIMIASLVAAMSLAFIAPACARDNNKKIKDEAESGHMQVEQPVLPEEGDPEVQMPGENTPQSNGSGATQPEPSSPETEEPEEPVQPKITTVKYIMPTADGVNLRAGAGTGYKAVGTAEKNTLYALSGSSGGWLETKYKNGATFISSAYCKLVEMDKSDDAAIERVIKEGCKLLGTKYVYGAVRYHDGSGKKLSGFTASAFDCSSLMQYIFKLGANINLQVNTRTQIYQGTTVKKGDIRRGDLLFFTNASRKNLTGIERVGHVALYLGDNYILHTASDYAKIEQISPTRWGYYIQAQRLL